MRPTPKILLQQPVSDFFEMQVAHAEAWWIVTFQNRPIQLREIERHTPHKKYIKNGSPHRTTAENLADRMNTIFQTTEFRATKVL
jgi:hypothetical protein